MDSQVYDTSWTLSSVSCREARFLSLLTADEQALSASANQLFNFITIGQPTDEDDDGNGGGVLGGCSWKWSSDNESLQLHLVYSTGVYQFQLFKNRPRTRLPLLAARAPAAVVRNVVQFFSRTFDAHIIPLNLSPWLLQDVLQRYLDVIHKAATRSSSWTTLDLVKTFLGQIKITFSFHGPMVPGLKDLDILIPPETLIKFLPNTTATISNATNPAVVQDLKFTGFCDALADYLHQTVGIKIPRPFVSDPAIGKPADRKGYLDISRIACGVFILSTHGRFKMVDRSVDNVTADLGPVIQNANADTMSRLVWEANHQCAVDEGS